MPHPQSLHISCKHITDGGSRYVTTNIAGSHHVTIFLRGQTLNKGKYWFNSNAGCMLDNLMQSNVLNSTWSCDMSQCRLWNLEERTESPRCSRALSPRQHNKLPGVKVVFSLSSSLITLLWVWNSISGRAPCSQPDNHTTPSSRALSSRRFTFSVWEWVFSHGPLTPTCKALIGSVVFPIATLSPRNYSYVLLIYFV